MCNSALPGLQQTKQLKDTARQLMFKVDRASGLDCSAL